jgi:hypothetical protein
MPWSASAMSPMTNSSPLNALASRATSTSARGRSSTTRTFPLGRISLAGGSPHRTRSIRPKTGLHGELEASRATRARTRASRPSANPRSVNRSKSSSLSSWMVVVLPREASHAVSFEVAVVTTFPFARSWRRVVITARSRTSSWSYFLSVEARTSSAILRYIDPGGARRSIQARIRAQTSATPAVPPCSGLNASASSMSARAFCTSSPSGVVTRRALPPQSACGASSRRHAGKVDSR